MSVRFLCTSCGTSIKAKDEYSGKAARCPHCRERIVVPADDQPNDVLEIGDDYGLAAMSVGEIEIDNPRMHVDIPKARASMSTAVKTTTPLLPGAEYAAQELSPVPPETTNISPATARNDFPLLVRASNGLLMLAVLGLLIWLYILGGQFIEFCFGGNREVTDSRAFGSSLLDLATTFLVGGALICLLAGISESLKVLLDIRNILNRRGSR